MYRKMLLGVAAAAGSIVAATPVAAQNGPVGQWMCRTANQTANNIGFENWMYEFRLVLNANGQFQAQGTYTSHTAGSTPFQAGGSYQTDGRRVIANGQEQRGDGYAGPFHLLYTTATGNEMSHRFQGPAGNQFLHCRRG